MPRETTRRRTRLWRAVLTLAAAFSLGLPGPGARAQEYRLQAGDVIEMSVVGLPEMATRSPVQIDGSLSLPAVGDIAAAGRPLSEVRELIRTSLASRLLLVYLPDGSQVTRAVDRDQVTASVVEYRPVFVSGDVAQPGEHPFRPGMTVRQIIAAAGGVMSVSANVPGYDPAALRADYAGAWHAAAAAGARVWRIRRELGEDLEFDHKAWPPAPEAGGVLDGILSVETDILRTRAQNYRHETTFMAEQLKQIEAQSGVLQRQLEVEKVVEQSDAENLQKATKASESGILTQSRLQDVRSAALFSSTRRLQTEVNLMQLERRRTEVSREAERLDEGNRLDLLDELQKAKIVEGRERARLFGAAEQLRAVGMAPAITPDGVGIPQITIIRGGAAAARPAALDSRIEPGDVIEVRRTSDEAAFTGRVTPGAQQGARTTTVMQ
ncbi:polysaccharide biosynthesis/export family protein [Puniceibacterium confluentis]|uniref:polysaccharide biosynthesis/export family protein n=1 Tax=Puniceibacterium confluentis TaxID=1958944 RepID=UPI0011B37924|nr:polysaccharide biosynthesis/export family protein [Puniceibacterium confluentis]